MTNIPDALAHIDDALDALTLEGWTSPTGDPGSWERMPAIECTLAIEMERVDCAIGPRGQSMFFNIGEQIKRAVIDLVAARQALSGERM